MKGGININMNQNEKNEARLPGMIEKAATIKAYEVTDTDLRLINKHTLRPLTAEEVFVFKAILCDNEVDRTFERFGLRALQDLKKLLTARRLSKITGATLTTRSAGFSEPSWSRTPRKRLPERQSRTRC